MLIAVIDLGKSNKKVALIDESLAIVAARQAAFPAQPGDDGVLCEQIDAIWAWLGQQLGELYREQPFHAVAVTTHGATWAGLAADGSLAIPVIAYEHDLGEQGQRDLDHRFYGRCGQLATLQAETATCDLPLLVNPAKMILFAQERWPERWKQVARIIDYPQYWGFRLTGVQAAEATYTCNHSFLYDFARHGASTAAHALGVADKLDLAFRKPWDRLGTLSPELQQRHGLPALPVAVGIHDSNAALLPYLLKYGARDFVLNSTGTWCVAMHRVDEVRYRAEELGQKVIFNRHALGGLAGAGSGLTKVSFLMGGMDYALYHDLIGGADPGFDAARLDATLTEVGRLVLPGAFPSQFPQARGGLKDGHAAIPLSDLKAGRTPGWFKDPVRGHDLLNVSLALQTEIALRRTDLGDRTTVFIEGGFRNNPTFLAVLAALFPHQGVCCTNLAQATSSGTALLGHAMLRGVDPTALASAITIDETPVARPALPHLMAYRAAWTQAAS